MARIGFVILHYNVIEETIKCVESIQSLERYEDIFIVLVDNASPNNSGVLLKNMYANDKQIDVILREHNDGFSRGNNEGCAFAITKWNPDFLVVANNDVIFTQLDFCQRIENEYAKEKFAILGPDIYNPNRRIHQNPLSINPPSLKEVNRTIFMNQMVNMFFPILYPLLKWWHKNTNINTENEEYKNYLESVCLMGACLIYSRDYFESRKKIFYPETRFYYEEYIQSLWCREHEKRVVYHPKLQVFHMEGKATSSLGKQERKKIRFQTKNILDAASTYRRCLIEGIRE